MAEQSAYSYDYLVVGSGLFGATFANLAHQAGYRVLVLEKRSHVGGNVYTEVQHGIMVHCYGAHIFHTNDVEVWQYVNRFATFNGFINSPMANYRGQLYNLPFNMNTFHQLWGVTTPRQAQQIIAEQAAACHVDNPADLEQQALSMVGRDVYQTLIKGYTEKQWGRSCHLLPPSIIKRIPCRFTYDNRYFDDCYQGVPTEGYTAMVQAMLNGVDVLCNTDYFEFRQAHASVAPITVYTGTIDAFFNYCYGALQYRSLRFETQHLQQSNYQGVAVVNYTDSETPYTRCIEHKHFVYGTQSDTVVSYEYPCEWQQGAEPYYPIGDQRNLLLYDKYRALADDRKDVVFAGRLGQYRYYDMDDVVRQAMLCWQSVAKPQ